MFRRVPCLAGVVLALPTAAQSPPEPRPQVIVQVPRAADRLALEERLASAGCRVIQELPALDLLLIDLPRRANVANVVARLARVPGVAFAEPNARGEGGALFLNDTHWVEQWPLDNIGQGSGTKGADIEALNGWSLARGSAGVIVAVLDSGLAPNHPEFTGRVLPGFDFINQDADPADDHGHGTAVSGVLAANAENAFGLAGVDHRCTLLPVKVLDRNNGGTVFSFAQGLTYAADAGARVVNMSLINYPLNNTVNLALQYARDAGCVLVACAGNGGPGDADVSGPGRSPLTISVGATTKTDTLGFFSGTGVNLDLVAPGQQVPATIRSTADAWGSFTGCSAATPIVSGIAAVLLSVDPTLTHDEVQQVLEAGAEDRVGPIASDPSGRDDNFGHGRANLFRSLCQLDAGAPTIVAADVLRVASPGPAGLAADDPAVIAALESIGAVDDLDPQPKVVPASPGALPLGKRVAFTVTAADACGKTTQRTLEIVAEDRGAPLLTLLVEQGVLDPALGGLQLVGLRATAKDGCDPAPEVEVRAFTDEAPGRDPDAQRDQKGRLLLRAERDAAGDGRVYLMLVRARDKAGNAVLDAVTVVVPKDPGPASLALVLDQATRARDTSLATDAPPAGYFEL